MNGRATRKTEVHYRISLKIRTQNREREISIARRGSGGGQTGRAHLDDEGDRRGRDGLPEADGPAEKEREYTESGEKSGAAHEGLLGRCDECSLVIQRFERSIQKPRWKTCSGSRENRSSKSWRGCKYCRVTELERQRRKEFGIRKN